MEERPLQDHWSECDEVYRHFHPGRGLLVRVERHANRAIATCKRFTCVDFEDAWTNIFLRKMGIAFIGDKGVAVGCEARTQELNARQFETLEQAVRRASFWSLRRNEGLSSGLDGWNAVFEAGLADRHHVIERWCPERTPFGKLCDDFATIHDHMWDVRRPWWKRWWGRREGDVYLPCVSSFR